ncbi:hypothetical protein GT347_02345 [Xylophilus rhododendri]|uniref:Uncharacterized protein n=1 Tax=Xylophilus rhododendri TaxID=2697032 RepID=A0A857J1U9_9BURK|nr:hypothetical protein [Xylophilus rhododendri]QHI96928.1 hypothetical protein GT347_02345 [Xylophilus rhododendri]
MGFNIVSNTTNGNGSNIGAVANLALGLMGRYPRRVTLQNNSRPSETRVDEYRELNAEMATLLGLTADDVGRDGAIQHSAIFSQDADIEPEKPLARKKRNAPLDFKRRLDVTLHNALAGFRTACRIPGETASVPQDPFEKRQFQNGESYGGGTCSFLNTDEINSLRNDKQSPLRQILEGWVRVQAHSDATGSGVHTWKSANILAWARDEVKQVISQADKPDREERLRDAFQRGRSSPLAFERLYSATSPLDCYPDLRDLHEFAECGVATRLIEWIGHGGGENHPIFSISLVYPDPAQCKGDATTHMAYITGRRIGYLPDWIFDNPKVIVNVPRGVTAWLADNVKARNCGPDNILRKVISRWNPFAGDVPACPPFVTRHAQWRAAIIKGILDNIDYWQRKRQLEEDQVPKVQWQQVSPPARTNLQRQFDRQSQEFREQQWRLQQQAATARQPG